MPVLCGTPLVGQPGSETRRSVSSGHGGLSLRCVRASVDGRGCARIIRQRDFGRARDSGRQTNRWAERVPSLHSNQEERPAVCQRRDGRHGCVRTARGWRGRFNCKNVCRYDEVWEAVPCRGHEGQELLPTTSARILSLHSSLWTRRDTGHLEASGKDLLVVGEPAAQLDVDAGPHHGA